MPLFSRRPERRPQRPRTTGLRADPHLAVDLPLVQQARDGDPGPLGVRLAELREKGRSDHRDTLLQHAVPEDTVPQPWLEHWRAADPDDPDVAALWSRALVVAAWAARSRRRADEVSAEQVAAFHDLLLQATDALEEAARRTPSDPAAWTPLFDHCRGLDLGLERLHDLVSRATGAASAGFAWRLSAVDFLSPFWFGSLDESWDFAVTSAELHTETRMMLLPAVAAVRGLWHERTEKGEAMIRQALPPALDYVRGADDEVEQTETANLMAALLHAAGLDKQARVFAQVAADRVATAPWLRLVDGDPLTAFASAAQP